MMMNTPKISEKQYHNNDDYISPQVEVILIDVEKGFSSSEGGNESYDKEPGVWD